MSVFIIYANINYFADKMQNCKKNIKFPANFLLTPYKIKKNNYIR